MRLDYRSLAVALTSTATASSQLLFTPDVTPDIRYRWAIPEGGVQGSNPHDVYVQVSAPDSLTWVGVGIGTGMLDAEIFLLYQDGEGNLTLSTRVGRHHIMPLYQERLDTELIEGSGVQDGRMVANIRCGDCGSLSLDNPNTWISAWLTGDSLNDPDPDAQITFHGEQNKILFDVDLAQATIPIEEKTNPFLDGEEGGNSGGVVLLTGDGEKYLIVHGVLMSVTFIAVYPVGALLMPLFRKWFLHSISQLVAYILMWVGLAFGVLHAQEVDYLGKQAHTRLGLVVVVLLFPQPIFGWLQHRHYTKYARRGWISQIHVWYGRALMILGAINGGLGLQLAENTGGSWMIVYTVFAAVMGIAYVASIVYRSSRDRRRKIMEEQIDPLALPSEPDQNQFLPSGYENFFSGWPPSKEVTSPTVNPYTSPTGATFSPASVPYSPQAMYTDRASASNQTWEMDTRGPGRA